MIRIFVMVAMSVTLVACGPSAASRFSQAVRTIATNTGANADDVAAGLRRSLSSHTEDELAHAAEGLASRTSWVDDATRAATVVDSPEVRHLRAMTASACETLDFAEEEGRWPTPAEFQAIVRANFADENLISAVIDAAGTADEVAGHLQAIVNGEFDIYQAFVDGACAAV